MLLHLDDELDVIVAFRTAIVDVRTHCSIGDCKCSMIVVNKRLDKTMVEVCGRALPRVVP